MLLEPYCSICSMGRNLNSKAENPPSRQNGWYWVSITRGDLQCRWFLIMKFYGARRVRSLQSVAVQLQQLNSPLSLDLLHQSGLQAGAVNCFILCFITAIAKCVLQTFFALWNPLCCMLGAMAWFPLSKHSRADYQQCFSIRSSMSCGWLQTFGQFAFSKRLSRCVHKIRRVVDRSTTSLFNDQITNHVLSS